MTKQTDFITTFSKLKALLQPYESKLIVVADTEDHYALETPHVMKNKHRVYFAGVKIGKSYVSYHLMPVYALEEVRDEISPELKKRMQGKSCFNFSEPDEKLFKELARLTKVGFKRFTSKDFYSRF
ncbi:MAG TPA: hypothetical protein VJ372_04575 [Pyrinomonadaceae bacterium]|jgi:hypothetical protein|nr:hypothetical protein [Pyrinomonadaceae bacterium]